VNLTGTRKAHLLKVQANNNVSKFYVQLAGGFNQNNDWLGKFKKEVLIRDEFV
jgi:translocation and assembly module TamB